MRVTTKGQVTIPKPVRRRLGIKPGTEVEFVLRDGEAVLRTVAADMSAHDKEVAEFMSHLRSFRGAMDLGGLTPDEFMSLLRD
jgi:AbrB family looped-hinge helix DNA binding protein